MISYVSGRLGTLIEIEADLLNLKKMARLGVPVASTGGTRPFDGVFLSGIIALSLTPI